MTTFTDTLLVSSTEAGPLDEGTSHALLFRAACAAEDDVLTELAAARRVGDEQAVARLTAERGLFDRLAVDLRTNRRAQCSRDAG